MLRPVSFPAPGPTPVLMLVAGMVLAGCAGGLFQRDEAPRAPAAPDVPVSVTLAPGEDVLRPEQRPDARADARTDAPDAPTDAPDAPDAPGAGDGLLGETLAGLGSPSEGGMWLRTGLVDAVQPGRVETERGDSVAVELRPSGREPASGSHISLQAMQALDLPLTELATLRVFAGR